MAEFVHIYQPPTNGDPITLLMLHGTGGDEENLLPLAKKLRPTAGVLSLRGQVLEQGLPRFFRRFAEGVFDEEDLMLRTSHVAEFVTSSAARYGFDSAKVVVVGYSNGANMGTSLIFRHPEVVCAGALFRCTLPYEPANPPNADGKQVLLLAAENDPHAPPEKVRRVEEILIAGGVQVTVHWETGGHGMTDAEVEFAAGWMRSLPA